MKFLVDPVAEPGVDFREVGRRFDEYQRFLLTVRDRLPPSAFALAVAPWHYDITHHRSLHDSWLESLVIEETPNGDDMYHRVLSIRVRLLGPFHDGHTYLTYPGVVGYRLDAMPGTVVSPHTTGGHGDWLQDEIRPSARGYVEHDIRFEDGTSWLIEAREVEHRWVDLTSGSGRSDNQQRDGD